MPSWLLVPGAVRGQSARRAGLRVVPVARFERQRHNAASLQCDHDNTAHGCVSAEVCGYYATHAGVEVRGSA